VSIHFTWKKDWPNVRRLLPLIEEALSPFEARPHWGKLFAMDRGVLSRRYDRMADFLRLAEANELCEQPGLV
jgi:xylitol oxidase